MASLRRLDSEVRENSILRVTVDPELGPRTFSVTPPHDVSEPGVAQRSFQGFEVVEKRAEVTVEKPIDPFAPVSRLPGDRRPERVVVCDIGLGDLPAIGPDQAERPAWREQSMEFPEDRRARLDGQAIQNVVREDRGERAVIQRQWASKIAPEIHRTPRPPIHVHPSGHDPITTSEVEQELPLSTVGVGSSSPPGVDTISNTNGPENDLAMNALDELDRDRSSLDQVAYGVSNGHRASES
jgi:hypothetical protein